MEFHPELTVLVGSNGSGKSAILDAISLALGAYIRGFSGIPYSRFAGSDVRLVGKREGKWLEQWPVRVSAQADILGHLLAWTRSLQAEGSRTTDAEAGSIMQYAAALQEHLRLNAGITLPLVACYGAGRQWMRERDGVLVQKGSIKNRQSGYLDCLNPAGNEKMLLNWFENMTYSKMQKQQASGASTEGFEEALAVPALCAVKSAMGMCYRSAFPEAVQVSFDFNVVNRELEITTTYPDQRCEQMPMRLLSDGIKSILMMVADIAYRMAVLNPQFGAAVLENTPGIVLIDEVELHLHPAWQKTILADLRRVFPLVQWIVTTRSPCVLASAETKSIRLLKDGQIYRLPFSTYGKSSDAILENIMMTRIRPEEVQERIDGFYDALRERDFPLASETLVWLRRRLGEQDADVIHAASALELMDK